MDVDMNKKTYMVKTIFDSDLQSNVQLIVSYSLS